ncbi:NCS2 family permease [Funiculus sociatus GB2-A5]|uniref:NCS2 family permease n=1 Tax=Funiculus sociatus GB2-A5 TaxID=2933946 RepID=A0ABV0JR74_9CYAN|nr:NCS2 family permease [Trichocoleus sp. FACHB-6]MBD2061301.1 NCS2 family permease [Trichocoleus sp. FACHB-6]
MKHDDLSEREVVASRGSSPPPSGWQGAIARFFKFDEFNTNFRTEVLAGVTTFMTMAYILAVNPGILSNAIFLSQPQDLFGELVIATALSSAIATLVMGLTANYPFALAPGMGLNAFFAFSVVLALKIDWRVALSAVLIEGLIFIALTLSNIRSQIIKAIPECLKQATAAGIGLFIAYIGLAGDPKTGGAGIIVAHPATKTALGNFAQPTTLVAIAGILITAAFVARRIKGALLWGILATALLGWILRIAPAPSGIVALPQWPGDLFGQAVVGLSQIGRTNIWDLVAVTFVFLFIDLFDTIGTLAGVGTQAGYIDENGELPRASEALMADAVGTTVGAILGTSTVTTYIESAAGVSEGGRTGFTAVVTAILFTLSIFFIPLLSAVPAFATAPALLIVGVLMAGNVRMIRWDDPAESIPSFLTILLMPLTYSIAEGLAIGFITYPLIKSFQGKAHEISLAVWILAGIFVLRFVLMAVRSGS